MPRAYCVDTPHYIDNKFTVICMYRPVLRLLIIMMFNDICIRVSTAIVTCNFVCT